MRSSNRMLSCVALVLFLPPAVLACSCGRSSPQEAFDRSSAVFVGELIRFEYSKVGRGRERIPRFRVKEQWKGELAQTIALPVVDIRGCSIDLKLVKGKSYLLYARTFQNRLWVFVDCNRSRDIDYADTDLEYLKRLRVAPAAGSEIPRGR